jgi:hypothetical protein
MSLYWLRTPALGETEALGEDTNAVGCFLSMIKSFELGGFTGDFEVAAGADYCLGEPILEGCWATSELAFLIDGSFFGESMTTVLVPSRGSITVVGGVSSVEEASFGLSFNASLRMGFTMLWESGAMISLSSTMSVTSSTKALELRFGAFSDFGSLLSSSGSKGDGF